MTVGVHRHQIHDDVWAWHTELLGTNLPSPKLMQDDHATAEHQEYESHP